MQQNDDIVSGWLEGSDSVEGHGNPAGSLYIQGLEATEAALTSRSGLMITGGTTACSTSASAINHCVCC